MNQKFLLLLVVLGIAMPARAGTTFTPGMEVTSNVSVEIESWLETSPQVGMVPLKVRIRNGDNKVHTWEIRTTNGYSMGGMSTQSSLTVGAEQNASMIIYAPVTLVSRHSHGSLSILVEGYGVVGPMAGNLTGKTSGSRSGQTEYVAMGKKLSSKGWSSLRSRVGASGGKGSTSIELNGSEVDMVGAPEDWQGYSGLTQFWLDSTEWQTLGEKQKGAVLEWVAMGGRLFVLDSATPHQGGGGLFPMIAGASEESGTIPLGSGMIEVLSWNGKDFPLDQVHSKVKEAPAYSLSSRLEDYDSKWSLGARLGKQTLNTGLVFGFILIFGLLIGPVNLFWLAGGSRRHRLFLTTPLLSLGGSALLVGLMVIQDGIGGTGSRLIVATLLPDQKKLVLEQEQASRTGVLLGATFPVAERGWMLPLELGDRKTFSFAAATQINSQYLDNGGHRWGDWFSSRSVQGHLLRSVRSTRAMVEFIPRVEGAEGPHVISSVEVPLAKLFVIDEKGAQWVVEDVGTGEKKLLKPAGVKELEDWMRTRAQADAGPVLKQTLRSQQLRNGYIYAEAADARPLAVNTLSSIKWKDDLLILVGPYVTGS
jgi:hypothetical protein